MSAGGCQYKIGRAIGISFCGRCAPRPAQGGFLLRADSVCGRCAPRPAQGGVAPWTPTGGFAPSTPKSGDFGGARVAGPCPYAVAGGWPGYQWYRSQHIDSLPIVDQPPYEVRLVSPPHKPGHTQKLPATAYGHYAKGRSGAVSPRFPGAKPRAGCGAQRPQTQSHLARAQVAGEPGASPPARELRSTPRSPTRRLAQR